MDLALLIHTRTRPMRLLKYLHLDMKLLTIGATNAACFATCSVAGGGGELMLLELVLLTTTYSF